MQGRIGPNAITRLAEASAARLGDAATRALFGSAGLEHHLQRPPQSMVAQDDVAILHARLRECCGAGPATAIARDAGGRTGRYLLAHRIPSTAQSILRALPAPLAAFALSAAIGRHAWTFAGDGRFRSLPGRPWRLSIAGCPLCSRIRSESPACDYYASTFETIFRELVHPEARVAETGCQAAGAPACTFSVTW